MTLEYEGAETTARNRGKAAAVAEPPKRPLSPAQARRAEARAREEAAPFVDELTALGVARERMPAQADPPAELDGPPGVTEVKSDSLRIYKPVEYGWKPVVVRRGAVEACIESGFRFECGDCGTHCCVGEGSTLNDCPGRPKMKFTRCPLQTCRKAIYDTGMSYEEDEGEVDDPNEIQLIPQARTPEARLKVKLDRHLRGAHPSLAEELGVAQDPFLVPNAYQIAAGMQPVVPPPVHPADRGN